MGDEDEFLEQLTKLMTEPLVPDAVRTWQVNDVSLYRTVGHKWRAAVVMIVNEATVSGKTHHEGSWHTFTHPTDEIRFVANLDEFNL